jgi:hypothetical protein
VLYKSLNILGGGVGGWSKLIDLVKPYTESVTHSLTLYIRRCGGVECLIPASDLGAEDSFELEFSKFEALSPIPPLPPDYLAGEAL